MELTLCERFPSLNPFQIRKEKACEVFLLLRRLRNNNEKQHKKTNKIRRPAGDNWF